MEYAIGLMSGTSLDGIDVALVDISDFKYQLIDFFTVPFELAVKERITECLSLETSSVALICSLNIELGIVFGQAAKKMMDKHHLSGAEVSFIASHGQTLYHQPVATANLVASTLQLGESSYIAEITGTTVVSDFRYRDMAVGGQGAPIVPFTEFQLYKSNKIQRILQNIGGISNATIIPKNASVDNIVAFDTGPGNMIIDELMRRFFNKEYDENGYYASLGNVNEALLSKMMSHPFISKVQPKTTGREEFGVQYVDELLDFFDMAKEDWIKTATVFTAKSIADSLKDYLNEPTELIVGGGGSYNPVLIESLKKELPNVLVMIQEDIGNSSDAKEAVAMAILGHQTINKRVSNVPSATGASQFVILGKVTYY